MTVPTTSHPLRLLIFSSFPPGNGGGELQTLAQCRQLVSDGVEVAVVDLEPRTSGPRDDFIDGINVRRVRTSPLPLLRSIQYHARLAMIAWREAPRAEVVQFNHIGTGLISASVVVGAFRRPRIVVLWGSCAPGVGPFGAGLRHALGRFAARRLESVVVLATSAIPFVARSGFRSDRIRFIPNGVDCDRFHPPEPDTSRAGVATVGRLVPAKGLDVLLDAWKLMRLPEIPKLVLVGDGPLRRDLEAKVAELGLTGLVEFAGQRMDVPDRLRGSAVYVSASRTEGMSNALLEAIASGLPIVATRVGGAEDAVVEGVNGILVPAGEPAALARALESVLGDAEKRVSMGQASRRLAIERFSLPSVVGAYRALYRELIQRRLEREST